MSIISYAQNFEDVMLWRALAHVQNGFYVDIGAQHPLIDSVSKAFYEKGWRGIHVEATPAYASLLRQDRPDETVIQATVNDAPGVITFYEIPETGLSTGDAAIAQSHRARDFDVHEITVPCITLLDVFTHAQSKEIHWLKIDVEGMELQVLRSWGECKVLPWIVVIESTLPLTQTENYQHWESRLMDRGYTHVYFDGLNRYYLSPDHPELAVAFSSGPNVFDGFTFGGTASSSFCAYVNEKHRLAEQALQQQLAQVHQEQIDAKQGFDAALAEISSRLHGTQEEELKIKARFAEEGMQHIALERGLLAEIQTLQTQWRQAEKGATRREQALRELASETSRQAQTEVQTHLHTLAQREQAFTQQLQELQTQMREAQAEASQHERALQAQSAEALQQAQTQVQAHLHTLVQREQAFAQQLQELQTQMGQADQGATQREHALRELASETYRQAQTQAQDHLHTLAQREQVFAQQLQELQTQMREAQAEASQRERALQTQSAEALQQAQTQAQDHLHTLAQREQAFAQQLQELQSQMREAQAEASQRERALQAQSAEALQQAQTEAQAHLHTLAQREQAFAQQLQQLQELQTQMRDAQAEAVQRERALQAQSAEALQQAQTEAQAHLHTLAQREQAFAQQLQELQTQMRDAEQGATRREQTLRELASETSRQAQTEAQAHLHTLAQREQGYAQQLQELQTQMRDAQAEAVQRERALQAQSAEALQHAQTQVQAHLHTLLQREQAFAQQLQELQTQMRDADQEATQREHALRELASETYRHAQTQAQAHLHTLAQRDRTLQAQAAVEAQLRADILFEQQANLRLRQSLTWRMTAPLRALASFIGAKKNLTSSSPIEAVATGNLMTVAAEPQPVDVQKTSIEPIIPATADVANLHTPVRDVEEGTPPDAIVPPTSEASPISVQHVSMEPTMPPPAQATKPTAIATASTLDELLAWHDHRFIQCAYQTLLGRAPDPEGQGYYLGRLRTGFPKIQLIAQLRLSKEGKAHAVKLPGLDLAVHRHQQGRNPLVGWLFRWLYGGEGNRTTERRLRAIENQLGLLSEESSLRFNQMEVALAEVHHLVVRQTQSVVVTTGVTPMPASNFSNFTPIQPAGPDGLKQLSPRAVDIYLQLKSAAAIPVGRAA